MRIAGVLGHRHRSSLLITTVLQRGFIRDYAPCVRACYHASVIQSITIDCFAQEQMQTSPDCTRPPQTKQDASGLLQQYNRHSLALQNTADQPQQSGKYSIGGLEIGRRATRIRSGVFRGRCNCHHPSKYHHLPADCRETGVNMCAGGGWGAWAGWRLGARGGWVCTHAEGDDGT